MKKMKKIAALVLALSMVGLLAFPAAADDNTDDLDEVIGVIEDGVYINDYFDIAYMLPDDSYRFLSEEELELQGGISKALLSKGSLDLSDLPETWIDMMMQNVAGESMNATMTVVPEEAIPVYESMPLNSIVEMSLDALKENVGSAGMTVTDAEILTDHGFNFDDCSYLRLEIEYLGMTIYERMIYLYEDGFQLVMCSSSLDESKAEELFNYLFILDDDTDEVEYAEEDPDEDDDDGASASLSDLLGQLNGLLDQLKEGN